MRWIDEIIDDVRAHPHISAIHKQVLITRIEVIPSELEVNTAVEKLREDYARSVKKVGEDGNSETVLRNQGSTSAC